MTQKKRGNPNMTKGNKSVNPSGRPNKMLSRVEKADGWRNVFTGVGVQGVDKRMGYSNYDDYCTTDTINTLWASDGTAAAIIEIPAQEMIRAGFSVDVQSDDPDISKKYENTLDAIFSKLNLKSKIYDALSRMRAYGGSAILMGVSDRSESLDRPVVGSWEVTHLTVVDCRKLEISSRYTDILHPKFGEVKMFKMYNEDRTEIFIHESRFMIFTGPLSGNTKDNQWGRSCLDRSYAAIRDLQVILAGSAIIASDMAPMVFKMKDLQKVMECEGGDELVRKRMEALKMSMSAARMLVIDSEDEMGRKAPSIVGLDKMIERFEKRIASTSGIPNSLLNRESPGGLNANGQSELQFWYDTVRAMQERILVPEIVKLIETLGILDVEEFHVTLNPLSQMTQEQESKIRKTMAETDKIYIDSQVLSPEEVVQARFSGQFTIETSVDQNERGSLEPDPSLDE